MSLVIRSSEIERKARLFSVLGDSTRLKLVTNLVDGEKRSITELTKGSGLSRQAITKHLRILENAGVVTGKKSGRDNLYTLQIESLSEAREIIESIEKQWDETLYRLKEYLEK